MPVAFILIWWITPNISNNGAITSGYAGPYYTIEACKAAGQKLEKSIKKDQTDRWNFRSTVWWDCTPTK